MSGPDCGWLSMPEAPNVRCGRKAEIGVRSPRVRFWLKADIRRTVNYIGFASRERNRLRGNLR